MGPRNDPLCLPLLLLSERPDHPTPAFMSDQGDWVAAMEPGEKVAFASPKERDYPLHNPVAVWLSAAYAGGAHLYDIPVADGVVDAIKKAAVLFGIEKDVDEIMQFQASAVKQASTAGVFALQDGVAQFYPIGTPFAVRRAAEGVAADFEARRLPLFAAQKASAAIVKRAHELGLGADGLPARVVQLSVDTIPDVDTIRQLASARDKIANTDLYSATIHEGFDPKVHAEDTLEMWRDIDAHFGIKVSSVTPDPADILTYGIDKAELAKVAKATMIIDGKTVAPEVFTLVPEQAWQSWYPNEAQRTQVLDVVKKASVSGEDASVALELMDADLRTSMLQRVRDYHQSNTDSKAK